MSSDTQSLFLERHHMAAGAPSAVGIAPTDRTVP